MSFGPQVYLLWYGTPSCQRRASSSYLVNVTLLPSHCGTPSLDLGTASPATLVVIKGLALDVLCPGSTKPQRLQATMQALGLHNRCLKSEVLCRRQVRKYGSDFDRANSCAPFCLCGHNTADTHTCVGAAKCTLMHLQPL